MRKTGPVARARTLTRKRQRKVKQLMFRLAEVDLRQEPDPWESPRMTVGWRR